MPTTPKTSAMSSAEVRRHLVDALQLDLVGPVASAPDHPLAREILDGRDAPTRWYLTGYLVPYNAPEEDRTTPDGDDEIGGVAVSGAGDDDRATDSRAAKKPFLPSSIGISALVPASVTEVQTIVAWGDYERDRLEPEAYAALVAIRRGTPDGAGDETLAGVASDKASKGEKAASETGETATGETATGETAASETAAGETAAKPRSVWRRIPKGPFTLSLSLEVAGGNVEVPGSHGLNLEWVVSAHGDARVVSVYLINQRDRAHFGPRDAACVFQAELALSLPAPGPGFIPRPDTHAQDGGLADERTADLQYRDVMELAVGHGIATTHDQPGADGEVRVVRTTWLPASTVLRVEPKPLRGFTVELDPMALGRLDSEAAVRTALAGLPQAYEAWIAEQLVAATAELEGQPQRLEWARLLMQRAEQARGRMHRGIERVATDPVVRHAFALMNRTLGRASRKRNATRDKVPESEAKANTWRPFQLAFILLSLEGVVDPRAPDRKIADLLFFPTGGGKTEAYLGLAVLAMVLRRTRAANAKAGRGTSVLMRYTLRLLTLDQLGRAAAVVCALELERVTDPGRLGQEPFEIGLWVGGKATPNRMGSSKDQNPEGSARYKVLRYKSQSGGSLPVPIESCPWCGQRFGPNSFKLEPNDSDPTDLDLRCTNLECEPAFRKRLPIVTVDEPLYARLPAFIIATVDKLASLPWSGQAGRVLGTHHPGEGASAPKGGAGAVIGPPDLIIQDELHLISGPLGTMVGLYETGIDALASQRDGDAWVGPKIIASTATVRRADRQVRALFGRTQTALFPPPGPNRRDSFFAEESEDPDTGRLYVGVAAQGVSGKVVLLRTYQTLLSAGKRLWDEAQKGLVPGQANPVDPYMTLLGYFGALRELGGSRRIVEDEVRSALQNRGRRRRLNDPERRFANRTIAFEPVELTSRESTAKVAEAKARLELRWVDRHAPGTTDAGRCVDVALATNMISVGLDITRLGLMVVLGQPKSSAEYIQATSRVGREPKKPGLVVTLLSVHKPRDRSHYERFDHFHQTFYRTVEATSVTPFSLRALDRALPAVVIAMARHGAGELTPPDGAAQIGAQRKTGGVEGWIVDRFVERAKRHMLTPESEEEAAEAAHLEAEVRTRVRSVLDGWERLATEAGGNLRYQRHEGPGKKRPAKGAGPATGADPVSAVLLHEMLEADTVKFRAPRSMRDVEPELPVWVRTLGDEKPLEDEEAGDD